EEGSAMMAADRSGKGKALKNITTAHLDIKGVGSWSKAVEANDTCAVFEVDVRLEGQTELTSALQDAAGEVLCGAYYIYVKRLLAL
ncbi:MAG: hypothetical protein PHO37_06170, partial [Kiritimatiellae bacterium]|nr:hypothetical protein [Kiritimatiellia bacterium]